MGQSKGGGYQKMDAITPEIKTLLDQFLGQSSTNMNQAAQGFQQFLPGGGGGQAISDAAHRRFQQETVPSILGAFGQNVKGSSSLNNALATGASNLNTDLASQLSQLQLNASQGLSGIGAQQANLSTQTPQFAYNQKARPFWQDLLLSGVSGGGKAATSYLGGGA